MNEYNFNEIVTLVILINWIFDISISITFSVLFQFLIYVLSDPRISGDRESKNSYTFPINIKLLHTKSEIA